MKTRSYRNSEYILMVFDFKPFDTFEFSESPTDDPNAPLTREASRVTKITKGSFLNEVSHPAGDHIQNRPVGFVSTLEVYLGQMKITNVGDTDASYYCFARIDGKPVKSSAAPTLAEGESYAISEKGSLVIVSGSIQVGSEVFSKGTFLNIQNTPQTLTALEGDTHLAFLGEPKD